MDEIKLGDRVLASSNGTGLPRKGTVTAVMTGTGIGTQYMVHFDGQHGHSGPCVVLNRIAK